MDVSSVSSSTNLGSTPVQSQDKKQTTDVFSELFAMLFSNMLLPDTNQFSLMMDQSSTADSNSTSGNSANINQMLSIINNLRINGGQFQNTETIQGLINSKSLLCSVLGNNTDLQKLFDLSDNIPDELQEFINSINSSDSKGTESINETMNSNRISNISDLLSKDMNASELLNTQTIESTTAQGPGKEIDTLNTQGAESKTVSELKKTLEKININATAFQDEKSSAGTSKALNSSPEINYSDHVNDIKSVTGTNEDGINNSVNTQSEASGVRAEEKTSKTFETNNNFEQAMKLSNIKNETADKVNLQQKPAEASLIEKPQDLIDLTVEKFKTLRLPGATEVTVKLKPEELGEVSLKLVLEKGQINGSITAERKEVVIMLQNNLEQLKTDLKNSNVNLNNLSVNIQSGKDFDSYSSRKGFNGKQNKNNHRVVQAFEEEMQPYDLEEGFNIIA